MKTDSPPAAIPLLVIVIPLEGRPLLRTSVGNDSEAGRLADWTKASPALAAIVEAVIDASGSDRPAT